MNPVMLTLVGAGVSAGAFVLMGKYCNTFQSLPGGGVPVVNSVTGAPVGGVALPTPPAFCPHSGANQVALTAFPLLAGPLTGLLIGGTDGLLWGGLGAVIVGVLGVAIVGSLGL